MKTKARNIPNRYQAWLAWACLLWATLLSAAPAMAESGVSARYAQSSGNQLAIEIITGSNPPASIILIQNLPPGVSIISASPAPGNYNGGQSQVKWLLRNPASGASKITMKLDRKVAASEISAQIRFKPAQGGQMTTQPVEK